MQDLLRWSQEFLRKEPSMSWLENRREEFITLLSSRMQLMLEGKVFLVFCDDDYSWFEEFFIKNINKRGNERPLLPFFSLKALYPELMNISSNEAMELLNDMLDLAFCNGFIYMYIGKGSYPLSQIAKNKDDSYMWLIGEDTQNSFYLDAKDDALNFKLIDLFTIFDKSINAVLFDEVIV